MVLLTNTSSVVPQFHTYYIAFAGFLHSAARFNYLTLDFCLLGNMNNVILLESLAQ